MIGAGKYIKTCKYCGIEYKTDIEHQAYCTPTHKTYAYRERRLKKASGRICAKCGRPWTEPRAAGSGLKPSYCRVCQEYFENHYRGKQEKIYQAT